MRCLGPVLQFMTVVLAAGCGNPGAGQSTEATTQGSADSGSEGPPCISGENNVIKDDQCVCIENAVWCGEDESELSCCIDGTQGNPCVGSPGDQFVGQGCGDNEDCTSLMCLRYSDIPFSGFSGVCRPAPEGCNTRVAGLARDIETGQVLAGASVRVAGRTGVSANPADPPVLFAGQSGDEGRFNMVSPAPIEQALGLVVQVEHDGYPLSATIVATPHSDDLYEAGTDIHEVWGVRNDSLVQWSESLSTEMQLQSLLPLWERGGVVGLVRDRQSGEPMSGIVVESFDEGESQAFVRYLSADGQSFNADETSQRGIVLILNLREGEIFRANSTGVTFRPWETGSSISAIAIDIP